jgi:citrate lyase subunit beta / citryl-CoA lyase
MLFVPGDRPERFRKAETSDADVVILDLEDAVAEANKDQALQNALAWLDDHRAVVRVQEIGSPRHEAQIQRLQDSPGLLGLMVPKVQSSQDLRVAVATGRPVLPLIETARGVRNVHEVADSQGVARLVLGSLDLAADLGLPSAGDAELSFYRSTLVVASAAAGLPGPVDGIEPVLDDPSVLRTTTAAAVSLGMTAKLCIHPSQLRAIHDELLPSPPQVEWATQIVAHTDGGVGVMSNQMVDRPQVLRARQILARVERAHRD